MRRLTLIRRSLLHHGRTNLAVLAAVAITTATLTGALLVGDSLRGTLRGLALERLGGVSHVLRAPGYFRAALADDIAALAESRPSHATAAPVILLRGNLLNLASRGTVRGVNVLGVDRRFWHYSHREFDAAFMGESESVILNQPLADDLRVRAGDEVLVRVPCPGDVSPETLLGRREADMTRLRLRVVRVIPARDLGTFSLEQTSVLPRNAYIPLETLQRGLNEPERANTILISTTPAPDATSSFLRLDSLLRQKIALADLGLFLRTSDTHGYVALESKSFLLPLAAESAGRATAHALGLKAVGVLAHLANSIALADRPDQAVPYSTVAAVESPAELWRDLRPADGADLTALGPGDIILNAWAADQLSAHVGDTIQLTYYVAGTLGHLETHTRNFPLRAIVPLAGAAADRGFTPEYRGVTDVASFADWDPPFPIDLQRIRPQDDEYWRDHRATPKAFVALPDGQRLWTPHPARFGQLTSLRLYFSAAHAAVQIERDLLSRLQPAEFGLRIENLRARALDASLGTTDFGSLFLGFSFFLIFAALALTGLLFRLGVDRRAAEIGLLRAVGFTPRAIQRLLLSQGILVALAGTLLGSLLARGYATLMLSGLRSWWADAVRVSLLEFHAEPRSYVAGAVASMLVAYLALTLALHGLLRSSPRTLLAGNVAVMRPPPRRSGRAPRRPALLVSAAAFLGALLLAGASVSTTRVPQTTAFFGGGAAVLVAGIALTAHALRRDPRRPWPFRGRAALLRIGARNAARHAGRSVLTAGLVAAATFLITSLHALRLDPTVDPYKRNSGTGGFTLLAEADRPLTHDLNSLDGRAALGLTPETDALLAHASIFPFRVQSGDDASCLNLYRPTQPRLLGATNAFISRGGFAFSTSLSGSSQPWTLLHQPQPDGAIPVIADEAAARWQLHLALGDTLTLRDERGQAARLRLVALLKGSILQGALLVAEPHFTRLFPSTAGYSLFLIDVPPSTAATVRLALERELEDVGFGAVPTAQRLTELQAVQNTYLSTFQALGGLGLLLGTVGLASVLLRNVWERRRELALLRTLGFSRCTLGLLVLVENAVLVAAGMATGLFAGTVALVPRLVSHSTPVPWTALLFMFGAIFAAGLLAGAVALVPALRSPLLPALRSE